MHGRRPEVTIVFLRVFLHSISLQSSQLCCISPRAWLLSQLLSWDLFWSASLACASVGDRMESPTPIETLLYPTLVVMVLRVSCLQRRQADALMSQPQRKQIRTSSACCRMARSSHSQRIPALMPISPCAARQEQENHDPSLEIWSCRQWNAEKAW